MAELEIVYGQGVERQEATAERVAKLATEYGHIAMVHSVRLDEEPMPEGYDLPEVRFAEGGFIGGSDLTAALADGRFEDHLKKISEK